MDEKLWYVVSLGSFVYGLTYTFFLCHRMHPLFALPTWSMTRVFLLIVPTHPWAQRPLTLEEWHKGETDTSMHFDIIGWMWVFTIIAYVFLSWGLL